MRLKGEALHMRKLGINVGAYYGIPAEEQINYIKNAGFDSVFTGFSGFEANAAFAEKIAKAGLDYETLHAPYRGINSIWLPGEDGDAMLKKLTDCLDCAAKLGVPVIVVHLSSGEAAPHITDLGHERFARLVDHAGEAGVKIAFENQRKLANIAFIFELYRDASHVGFCWDNGHESCFTLGKRDYMALFGDRLIALHLHDNCGEFDKDQHMMPFHANIDFNRVAEKIRNSGFEGTLMLETIMANSNRYDGYTPEQFFAEAYGSVAKLRVMVDGE